MWKSHLTYNSTGKSFANYSLWCGYFNILLLLNNNNIVTRKISMLFLTEILYVLSILEFILIIFNMMQVCTPVSTTVIKKWICFVFNTFNLDSKSIFPVIILFENIILFFLCRITMTMQVNTENCRFFGNNFCYGSIWISY